MAKLKRSSGRSETGFSLVELLASLGLAGLIFASVMTIYLIGQKQYEAQHAETDIQDAVTLAMKDITKSVRRAEEVQVAGPAELLVVLPGSQHEYGWADEQLMKDGVVLTDQIKDIQFVLTESGPPEKPVKQLTVKITGTDDFMLDTSIYLRE